MAINTLNEKFMHDLGDIYDAEHRFLEAQQEMHQQASAGELRTMLQEHIAQTQEQIRNLDRAYELLGSKAKRVRCDAAVGLVTEGQKSMKEAASNPAVLDTVIAGAAAKVEHYEIASYRGLILAANLMGDEQLIQLLSFNLGQEELTARLVEQSLPALLSQALNSRAKGE